MQTNRVLKWIILSGIFLTLLIPFFVSSSLFFPFITGKNFMFRIIVEIIFALWLILAFRDSSYRPKKNPVTIAVGAFIVIIVIADFFGLNPYRSFWSNFERMEGLITHLHLVAYFLVLSCTLNTERLWKYFLNTAVGSSILLCLYSFFQLFGKITIDQSANRLDGTLGNAAYLALYMLLYFFITLFLLVRYAKTATMKWIYGIATLLQFIILYYTATRGALLGLFVGLLIAAFLILIFEKKWTTLRKISLGTLAGLVIITGIFLLARNTNFVQKSSVLSRFASISVTDNTTKSRFFIWGMAIKGWEQHPVLGWGQDNFNVVFNKYYDPRLYGQEQWFDRAHDIFFDWLIAGGALGLLAYLSLFGASLLVLWRKKSQRFTLVEKSIITGLLLGYLFQNIFVFDNLTSYIIFFTLLAFLSTEAVLIGDKEPVMQAVDENGLNVAALPAGILLAIGLVYFLNVPQIEMNLSLIDTLQAQGQGVVAMENGFKDTLAYGAFGKGEAREQLVQAATGVSRLTGTDQQKQDFILYAKAEMEEQIAENPEDARYELFLGSFLDNFGDYGEGLSHLLRAQQLSPGKQAIDFELGTNYLNSGQRDKALAVFKSAFDLEPAYDEARLIYAIAAVYNGKDDLVTQLYPAGVPTDNRLLGAYFKMGKYDELIALFQEKIAVESATALPSAVALDHYSLAGVYATQKKVSLAIAELNKASELDPTMKDKNDAAIKQLQAGN